MKRSRLLSVVKSVTNEHDYEKGIYNFYWHFLLLLQLGQYHARYRY